MAGILGFISLLSSSSSFLATNLFLPHHHHRHHNRQTQTPLRMRTQCTLKQQQQQHKDDNKLKVVAVKRGEKKTSEIFLLSITEGEGIDDIISIPKSGAWPIASCHGLFLMAIGRGLDIWNPVDDVMRTIPESSVPRPPTLVWESNLMHGFGFDPSSNDYKVVRFVDFDCDGWSTMNNFLLCNWVVELYSLKTQSWKRIAYPHGNAAHIADYTCVYINGFCYWKMIAPHTNRLLILPFDLANDTFPCALIPGPRPSDFDGFLFRLVEFEGSLAVVACQEEPFFEFELWVWNNNDGSWSKRGVWAVNNSDVNFYIPVGRFIKNGQMFLQNSMRELVLFDFAKQKLKNLGFFAAHGGPMKIFPYVD